MFCNCHVTDLIIINVIIFFTAEVTCFVHRHAGGWHHLSGDCVVVHARVPSRTQVNCLLLLLLSLFLTTTAAAAAILWSFCWPG